jgi:hypothetical protein
VKSSGGNVCNLAFLIEPVKGVIQDKSVRNTIRSSEERECDHQAGLATQIVMVSLFQPETDLG